MLGSESIFSTEPQTSGEMEGGSTEAKNVSAMQVLMEDFPVDRLVKFEGVLVTVNAKVRTLEEREKRWKCIAEENRERSF